MTIGEAVIAREVVVDHATARGRVRALERATLVVPAGGSVAIMGPSGCGKSTLLGLLAGLAQPTAGTVTIGDVIVSALPEVERVRFRRRAIGMIYQADNLLPYLTVEENVALQLAIAGHDDGDLTGGPAESLQRLQIDALARRLPDQLSGGQRQRAAVARAVVHRPAVILADEPTGALDSANAQAVVELLVEVHRDTGATLVMVTHDPDIAAHLDSTVQLARPIDSEPAERCRAG